MSLMVLGGIQLGLLVEVPLSEIGGRVLGMQFGVLVEVPRARGHAVWGAGDGRVLGDIWGAGGGAALRD